MNTRKMPTFKFLAGPPPYLYFVLLLAFVPQTVGKGGASGPFLGQAGVEVVHFRQKALVVLALPVQMLLQR